VCGKGVQGCTKKVRSAVLKNGGKAKSRHLLVETGAERGHIDSRTDLGFGGLGTLLGRMRRSQASRSRDIPEELERGMAGSQPSRHESYPRGENTAKGGKRKCYQQRRRRRG